MNATKTCINKAACTYLDHKTAQPWIKLHYQVDSIGDSTNQAMGQEGEWERGGYSGQLRTHLPQ